MSKPLKVLFVLAAEGSGERCGERLESWTRNNARSVKVEFIVSQNNTVEAVTQTALEGNYDAVISEDYHTFDVVGAGNFKSRDENYEKLGLTKKKEAWQEMDPNMPYSGIALVEHLRKAFKEANQNDTKFGYVFLGGENMLKCLFDKIEIKDNADFYLSTGYEGTPEHVEKIYAACGVEHSN